MRKRIFPRIVWFILLNCVIFILLVVIQFTPSGNFSQRIGDLQIKGRYTPESDTNSNRRSLDGGARVFFGGLEFQLASPAYITLLEDGVAFILTGGKELHFISHNSDELQISGKFPNDEGAVEILFKAQKSSVVRDNGNDTVNILYSGRRYQFSRSLQSLKLGKLVLLAGTPSISYRVVSDTKEFKPSDFIVRQAETAQGFSNELSGWINRNFVLWGQMGTQTDEDTVVAWCGEAIRRGVYRTAVSVVPVSFSTDPQRTWESAVYQFDRRIGVWERSARSIGEFEREKNSRVSRLLAERDILLFAESHLIEFLAIRGYNDLIDSLLSFAEGLDPASVNLEMAAGILENCSDLDKWNPLASNPFVPLAERAFQLAADGLQRAGDQLFVFDDGRANIEFNMRLGLAINKWAEKSGNGDWIGIGQSLIYSVISLSDDNGFVPASLVTGGTASLTNDTPSAGNGIFSPSGGRISSAKLYRLLGNNEHLPHATVTGTNGIWAWTASTSVNVTQSDNQMDIAVRFPVGETHYVMLRNVRPFALLQIYEMNWRRAVDFESYYNSSGWYYFEQERILVIKLSHRSNVENVKIYFTAPRIPEPQPPQEQQDTQEY
jgi:hypothetical protein